MKFFRKLENNLNVENKKTLDSIYFIEPLLKILKRIYLLDPENREKKLKLLLRKMEILTDILNGKVVTDFKEIEPRFFIENIISEIESLEDTGSIDFEISFDENFNFISDPEILKFIFTEVIKNSIWACKNQGKIGIAFKRDDYNIYIEISDSGIGVEKHVKNKIFLPFTQYSERFNRGFGLGLSMVKGLSKFIAAKIEVESYPGEGSIFRLILPRDLKIKTREPEL